MADVLVGSERRVLISGYGLPAPLPPADQSLLGRLDEIDLRLRQLEEQQRRPPADDVAAVARRHQHTKSLPSALQHVQARGTLVDRLNLLESRIRQLSCELDLDVGGGKAKAAAAQLGPGSSSSFPAEDELVAWPADSAPVVEPHMDPAAAMCAAADTKAAAAGGGWSAVEILQRGARQLHHRNKPTPPKKVKSLKEAKCACQKEKRKAEHANKASKRWFMVGC